MINKIAELEQELNEHTLVIKAFEKVDASRRCFRMARQAMKRARHLEVGGVLVERTVAEVPGEVLSGKLEDVRRHRGKCMAETAEVRPAVEGNLEKIQQAGNVWSAMITRL